MKTLLLIALLLTGAPKQQTEYILYCDSKKAHAYHKDYKSTSDYCRGLNRCSHTIKRITKAEAIRVGKGECGFCYGGRR